MEFTKKKIADAEMGYVVSNNRLLGEDRTLIASEGKGPAQYLYGPDLVPKVISREPGGCMGFADFPGRDDAIFMITRFYPVFRSEEAGIDLCLAGGPNLDTWTNCRILDLPFVHRILTLEAEGRGYLMASTVCGGKDFRDDWSRPGALYAVEIPKKPDGPWMPVPVLENIHRNHGMTPGEYKGRRCLYISADEGVFAITAPRLSGEGWSTVRILDKPVSELAFLDINGDGRDELVTIEPFHGDRLVVYSRSDDTWKQMTEETLSFGHGLSVGYLDGQASIVVGNRSASKDFVRFGMDPDGSGKLERNTIDRGSGTAGSAVVKLEGEDFIISSNPEFAEYAAYNIRGDQA